MTRAALVFSVSIAALLHAGALRAVAAPYGEAEVWWGGRPPVADDDGPVLRERIMRPRLREKRPLADRPPKERSSREHFRGRIETTGRGIETTGRRDGDTPDDDGPPKIKRHRTETSDPDAPARKINTPSHRTAKPDRDVAPAKRTGSIEHKADKTRKDAQADGVPPMPPGPLHVIVSIDKQSVTLFAGGVPVATSKISSGTPGHPTPLGVFTVIQKARHHVSNLYDAPMPYMQRITWSGSALHEGPLPGRPASHGCVRLSSDFAKLLWKVTRIGARVIITHDEVAPVAFDSPRLFAPQPKAVQAPALLRTADAANVTPASAVADNARPLAAARAANANGDPQAIKLLAKDEVAETAAAPGSEGAIKVEPQAAPPAPAPAATKPQPGPAAASMRSGPVSVFISLKEGRLYVRQNWEPLLETPVSIAHPERPIGTHVYTAMGRKADGEGLRWSVVTIPSGRAAPEPARKRDPRTKPAAELPPSTPSEALERISIPPDALARISALVTPGSSLIVSDNKLSGETGSSTDFIVLTR